MDDLTYVLLVFWLLWAAEGVRLAATGLFSVIGIGRRARVFAATWHWPHPWPTGWRATCPDIPFSVSPEGICNRPNGTAGRTHEAVAIARAWRWEDVKETRHEKGWVLVNGARFYRDTGHVTAGGLLAWAKMEPSERARRIESWIARMVRPANLERRRRVLIARTQTVATLNLFFFGLAALLTGYLASDLSARLPDRWSDVIGNALPIYGGYLLGLHVAAIGFAVRSMRKLKAARPDARGTALFSAAMLPPQAMRLRAVVGEAYFPLQHPLAYALAFAKQIERDEVAFRTLADLRWPIGGENDGPLAWEIKTWFREQLQRHVAQKLRAGGVETAALFAAPKRDGGGSVSYCPRCRSQFVSGATHCGDGVALVPLMRDDP
jgi:hypothetical protein